MIAQLVERFAFLMASDCRFGDSIDSLDSCTFTGCDYTSFGILLGPPENLKIEPNWSTVTGTIASASTTFDLAVAGAARLQSVA